MAFPVATGKIRMTGRAVKALKDSLYAVRITDGYKLEIPPGTTVELSPMATFVGTFMSKKVTVRHGNSVHTFSSPSFKKGLKGPKATFDPYNHFLYYDVKDK